MIIASASILEKAVTSLDIPAGLVQEVTDEYHRVCLWLGEEDSPLREFSPDLYPQGSFRLGTPIRPIVQTDEFDIDLVCQLEMGRDRVTQKELKRIVGSRLKDDAEIARSIVESRRCWRVDYRGSYHLDVLPALGDPDFGGTGILLTDTQLTRWQHSNPIGYATWFYDRMRPLVVEERSRLAKAAGVSIEAIPDWQARTPLQRSVQFLKRHRDLRFANQIGLRPPSIILTTLAGRAYRSEADLGNALLEMLNHFEDGIENQNGRWWIPNPAHPEENFADKWNETPTLRTAFLQWLDSVRRDVHTLLGAGSDREMEVMAEGVLRTSSGRTLPVTRSVTPPLESTSHRRRPEWPERTTHNCLVTATVHRGVRLGKALWSMNGGVVFKRAGIRFVATTDVPAPYEVKWQITNTGSEAQQAGQLRGGFDDGEGKMGTVRWERTAYRGTHLVEAFVLKNGFVAARSGVVRVPIAR